MSTDTRNFLAGLLDHWPVTIFLPAIFLMIIGFIVVTILWDRRDHAAAAAAGPAPTPVTAPVTAPQPPRFAGDPTARTEMLPTNGGRPGPRRP